MKVEYFCQIANASESFNNTYKIRKIANKTPSEIEKKCAQCNTFPVLAYHLMKICLGVPINENLPNWSNWPNWAKWPNWLNWPNWPKWIKNYDVWKLGMKSLSGEMEIVFTRLLLSRSVKQAMKIKRKSPGHMVVCLRKIQRFFSCNFSPWTLWKILL